MFYISNERVFLIDDLKDMSGTDMWVEPQVGVLIVPLIFFGNVGELIY